MFSCNCWEKLISKWVIRIALCSLLNNRCGSVVIVGIIYLCSCSWAVRIWLNWIYWSSTDTKRWRRIISILRYGRYINLYVLVSISNWRGSIIFKGNVRIWSYCIKNVAVWSTCLGLMARVEIPTWVVVMMDLEWYYLILY